MISENQKTVIHPDVNSAQKSENDAIIVWISGLSTLIYFFYSHGIRNHIIFINDSFKKILGVM